MSDHLFNGPHGPRLHVPPEAGAPHERPADEELIGKLPPEVGALLIVAGVIGIVLPGPGTPVFLAGATVLWPSVFGRVERYAKRRFPKSHRASILQLKQYLLDLEKRFPGSLGPKAPTGGSAGSVSN